MACVWKLAEAEGFVRTGDPVSHNSIANAHGCSKRIGAAVKSCLAAALPDRAS